MNICIYRMTQRETGAVRHYCRQERRVCSGIRQLCCTAPDLWPFWIVGFLAVMAIAWSWLI